MVERLALTSAIIEAFAGVFLSARYDDPRPTPDFHREAWDLYSSDYRSCMVIAPRDHAKSTGLTFDYILAEVLFRRSQYVILIGSTETKAAEQLSNISDELHNNKDLIDEFQISHFETDQKTEIIVVHKDGHKFRILARGAEQKIRGALWNGMRPDLIVCDDMEDDEQVESIERREKFRRWFFRAAKQALSRRGRIRVHGTILHEDSLLSRLRRNSVWKHLFYKAHEGYDDFSNILWAERWTEAELREKRREFEDDNDGPGYSQEFLNTPLDNNEAFFRKGDFLEMLEEDYQAVDSRMVMNDCGVDFAISKKDKANRSSFTVGCQTLRKEILIHDEILGRKNTLEIVETFFEIQQRHRIRNFYVEDGQIWQAIKPILDNEMRERDIWLICIAMPSTVEKGVRAQPLRKRHRAGGMRFAKRYEWYGPYEAEMLKFTGIGDAKEDDQVDSTSILIRGMEMNFVELEEDDLKSDEELEDEIAAMRARKSGTGGWRSSVTGY